MSHCGLADRRPPTQSHGMLARFPTKNGRRRRTDPKMTGNLIRRRADQFHSLFLYFVRCLMLYLPYSLLHAAYGPFWAIVCACRQMGHCVCGIPITAMEISRSFRGRGSKGIQLSFREAKSTVKWLCIPVIFVHAGP